MKFFYIGDPNDENDEQLTARVVSRLDPDRVYNFEINGPAVEVHADDAAMFEGNRHFKKAAAARKKKAKKKKS